MRIAARPATLVALAAAVAAGACHSRLVFPPVQAPASISVNVTGDGSVFVTAPLVDGASRYRVYLANDAPPGPSAPFVEVTADGLNNSSTGSGAVAYISFAWVGHPLYVSMSAVFGSRESARTAAVVAYQAVGPLSFEPSYVLRGPAGSAFGSALAIGDFDDDGRTDLAVGAPALAGGMLAVFPAGIGRLTTNLLPHWQIDDANTGDRYAASLAAIHSVVNGGDELLVGVPGFAAGDGGATRIHFYPGGDWITLWQESGGTGWQLGTSVAAGDVDGDGVDDALVGAAGGGIARLVFGSADAAGLSGREADLLNPGGMGSQFGASVAVLPPGGLESEGAMLVGAPGAGGGEGSAYFYRGAGAALPSYTVAGTAAGEALGAACASLGDPNRDGYTDFAIGAPGFAGGDGAVRTFAGAMGGPIAYQDYRGYNGGRYGAGLAAGDIDRDGANDLLVTSGSPNGASGVYLLRGDPQLFDAVTVDVDDSFGNGQFGAAVAVGDLDGDGIADAAIGAPGRDEVDVFTNVPMADPVVVPGPPLSADPTTGTVTVTGATFTDPQPAARYRCEWFWDDAATPALAPDVDCTPATLAPVSIALPPDGAEHWLRLRVTDVEDHRFAEGAVRVSR